MNKLIRYFQHAGRPKGLSVGLALLLLVLPFWLSLGVYRGDVTTYEQAHSARVAQADNGYRKGRHADRRWKVASLRVESRGRFETIAFRQDEAQYGDFVKMLGRIKPNDTVVIAKIRSNYGEDAVWKIESKDGFLLFFAPKEEIQRRVEAESYGESEFKKYFTIGFVLLIVLLVLNEWRNARSLGLEQKTSEPIVYAASNKFYMFTCGITLLILASMAWLLFMVWMKWKQDALYYLPMATAIIFGFVSIWQFLYCFRLARNPRHNILLSRDGLYCDGIKEIIGKDFVAWGEMRYCYTLGGTVVVDLITTAGSPAERCISFHPHDYSNISHLCEDILAGIQGELFLDEACHGREVF